jgi:hypothetical protein
MLGEWLDIMDGAKNIPSFSDIFSKKAVFSLSLPQRREVFVKSGGISANFTVI